MFHNQSTYNNVNDPYRLVALILAVAVIALLAIKTRSVEREAASSVPVWTALVASVVLLVGGVVRDQVDLSRGALTFWLWVEGVALLAVALALAVFVRERSPATG